MTRLSAVWLAAITRRAPINLWKATARCPLVLAFGLLLSLTASLLAEGVDDSRPSRGGITVHGHWVIDVRDPDGTVVAQREFDNAVTQTGRGYIARVLARTNYLTPWEIELGSSTGNGPCTGTYLGGVPNNSSCWIVDVGLGDYASYAGRAVFPTGTTTVGGAGGAQVILTGRITALTAGEINRVATHRSLCGLTAAGTPTILSPI